MYTLLHGLYKYLVQKDEYFILILGLDNAGKTVLALGFCYFRGYDTKNFVYVSFRLIWKRRKRNLRRITRE